VLCGRQHHTIMRPPSLELECPGECNDPSHFDSHRISLLRTAVACWEDIVQRT
jgi:hypothetical protein